MDQAGSHRVRTAGYRGPAAFPDYAAHALAVSYLADPGECTAQLVRRRYPIFSRTWPSTFQSAIFVGTFDTAPKFTQLPYNESA